MQPFDDDRSSSELDPQNEEVIAFLCQVHGISIEVEPEPIRQELTIAQVRQRLLAVRAEQMETGELHSSRPSLRLIEVGEHSSSPEKRFVPVPGRGWSRRLALLAAFLTVALLVGSLFMVFSLLKHSAPTLVTGVPPTIYALSGGWLQKIDAQDGTLLWKYQVYQASKDKVTNDIVEVSSNTGIVYVISQQKLLALKASNGSLLWSEEIGGVILYQPVIANNILYLQVWQDSMHYDNHTSLEAFDALSGHQLWHYDHDSLFTFAVANNVVYGAIDLTPPATGSNQGLELALVALNATDGSQRWLTHFDYPSLSSFSGGMVVADGRIYLGVEAAAMLVPGSSASQNYIYAYSISDGAFLWRSVGPQFSSNIEVIQNTLYIISSAGLYALRAEDGSVLWNDTNVAGAINCSALVQSGKLFCYGYEAVDPGQLPHQTSMALYIVELNPSNGRVINRQLVEGSSDSVPAMIHFTPGLISESVSVFCLPSHSGYLEGFDNQTGKRLWSTQLIGAADGDGLVILTQAV